MVGFVVNVADNVRELVWSVNVDARIVQVFCLKLLVPAVLVVIYVATALAFGCYCV